MIKLETESFTAFISDNEATDIHRKGYNGIASLIPKDIGNNIFVPAYCGLNYECTWIEGVDQTYDQMFEPRMSQMYVEDSGPDFAVLYQPPTGFKGIEARISFKVCPPCYIHQNVKLKFHKQLMKQMNFTSLWASYLHASPNRNVYMKLQYPDKALEGWIGITKEKHRAPYYIVQDLPSHELTVSDHLTLAENPLLTPRFEELDNPLSFYYGLYYDYAFIMMFKQPEKVRLAYSPNGGDELPPWSPAWDYMLNLKDVECGKTYEWDICLAIKPYKGRADVLSEVQRFKNI